MIDLSIVLIVAVSALLAVQAMDVECERPRRPRRIAGLGKHKAMYVPADSVTN